MKWGKPKNSRT